ncbi:hypothetical protein VNO80_02364 [Phaseolus coccineus]|uniref:Uncharacterized protein n=1 Tax=Phaseolus coccineus TaxID=3886 RepID=A0AAN9NUY3_PHACN
MYREVLCVFTVVPFLDRQCMTFRNQFFISKQMLDFYCSSLSHAIAVGLVKLRLPLSRGGCVLDKGLAMVSTNMLLVLVYSLNCTTSKDSIITNAVC